MQPKTYSLALSSLLLSLGYFLWWFLWPLFSLSFSSIAGTMPKLWLGLPMWFWASSIASLPLLFGFSWLLLPKDNSQEETFG